MAIQIFLQTQNIICNIFGKRSGSDLTLGGETVLKEDGLFILEPIREPNIMPTGKYEIEIVVYPDQDSEEVNRIIGKRGKNLSGKHVLNYVGNEKYFSYKQIVTLHYREWCRPKRKT